MPSLKDSFSGLFEPYRARPIERLVRPLQSFARHKLAGAGLLMLATVVALVWANSPWAALLPAAARDGGRPRDRRRPPREASAPLDQRRPDGALLLRRRARDQARARSTASCATVRKARAAHRRRGRRHGRAGRPLRRAQPVGGDGAAGWGIPMATDIAFALGVLGAARAAASRWACKVFLTALAIVDDIGADPGDRGLLHRATSRSASARRGLACCFVLSVGLNRLGVRSPIAYFVLGHRSSGWPSSSPACTPPSPAC